MKVVTLLGHHGPAGSSDPCWPEEEESMGILLPLEGSGCAGGVWTEAGSALI